MTARTLELKSVEFTQISPFETVAETVERTARSTTQQEISFFGELSCPAAKRWSLNIGLERVGLECRCAMRSFLSV
ncbi:hypothetical protein VCR9J2_90003 [Vibrio crassostreae]|nr:hypothetical protein VCR9J2_90003 [Vibrio crassostreae]